MTTVSTVSHTALITQSISVKKRSSFAFPIRNLRRYLAFISQELAIGASLIIRHPFTPPPVPTWPLHLALFVAIIRATADIQEHIVEDISDIRRLIDAFFYYLPKLPQMQIVPFKVPIPAKGRAFPGVLAQLEQSETGHRTLPAQWIADTRVWDRIMKMPIANTAAESKDPFAAREGEKVIFYTHGGGYFICSTDTHREMLWRISRATGRRIFAVDYRLAPEHPYPAAVQDASHAFSHLTDPKGCGFAPENVTSSGDSAGGGLTLALLMYQRDHGLPMASKAVLLSPWLDLTMSCDSWVTNSVDYLPSPPKFEHKFNPISFYCSGRENIKTLARHPYISPLWGDLEGLPPLLIQCGEAERLRDECILFTYKAGGCFGPSNTLPFEPETLSRDQNSHVELDMYPGMVHVFQAIPFLPEAGMALERIRDFMHRKEADNEAEVTEAAVDMTKTERIEDDSLFTADEQSAIAQLMEELVENAAIQSSDDSSLYLELNEEELICRA
ncbi:hypothetical protein BGZ79_005115 [Entomortierella chlamydospora]|nr:hypothetical protein BGZ79_005115 [Entomortierella chlamydospora]